MFSITLISPADEPLPTASPYNKGDSRMVHDTSYIRASTDTQETATNAMQLTVGSTSAILTGTILTATPTRPFRDISPAASSSPTPSTPATPASTSTSSGKFRGWRDSAVSHSNFSSAVRTLGLSSQLPTGGFPRSIPTAPASSLPTSPLRLPKKNVAEPSSASKPALPARRNRVNGPGAFRPASNMTTTGIFMCCSTPTGRAVKPAISTFDAP